MSDRTVAEEAIRDMQSEAVNFASRWITDARVRHNYLTTVRQFADELMQKVSTGELTPRQAAEQASAMRNHFLDMARLRSSDIGRATAEQIKPQGLTLEALLERYAQRTYQRAYAELTEAERDTIFRKIVESSGRADAEISARALRFGRLGRGLMVLSLAIAVYNVASANDKVEAAKREGVGLGGGFVGGAAGGALAGLACGPGAPVCVTIGAFVGGIAGALGADMFYDWMRH